MPRYLEPRQISSILNRCDRRSASGKRDHAILLLLARLGLRANEVATLSLSDIDWHSGRLMLRHTKTEQVSHLPLPVEVGEAIADYLKNGRPASTSRRVFLRTHAPLIGFSGSAAILPIVKRALMRAGIDATHKGPHLFRHSLATGLLRNGASLTEIGQLLRHQDLNSTRIYAKVDLTTLRALARKWPEKA
jgi:site-specific recombinase XerD